VDQQAAADEQHRGDGELGDHQRALGTGIRECCAQRANPSATQLVDGRSQSKHHPGDERDGQRKCQDANINRDVSEPRKTRRSDQVWPRQARAKCSEQSNAGDGQAGSGSTPGECEQGAFGEELSDQATSPGSERQTQCDFLLPRATSGKQEVADVDARDEQHEADRRSKNQEGRSYRRHEVILERDHLKFTRPRGAPNRRRILPDAVDNCRHLRTDRFDRHIRSHPRKRHHSLQHGQPSRRERGWSPELCRRIGKLKFRRHHADDGIRRSVQRDAAAEDVPIPAEVAEPRRMGKDNHRVVLLAWGECTAEERLDAQTREYFGRHAQAFESSRLRPRQDHRRIAIDADMGERLGVCAQRRQLDRVQSARKLRHGVVRNRSGRFDDPDQPV
jgi:hypothetical protein